MKFVPNTNENYKITKDKKIWSCKQNRFLKTFLNNRGQECASLQFIEGRRTKTVDAIYNMTYMPIGDTVKIPTCEKYSIARDGKIYSHTTNIEMKAYTDKDGYKRIALVNNEGIRKKYYVHRLVALTYIENPLNLPVVNHINEIKDDNRVENLEWCTVQQNTAHSKPWLNRKRLRGKFI